ncbi:MAG: GYD domain-containing protein [Ardenticatenaceae bacterium]|nr:GYD domain-containing protein [Ardenticatenaceae bacterium]HBY99061.1 GYD family protein [Chloroflexota bacterium]
MPAYITLLNFTEQGIRNVKDTVTRARDAAQAAQAAGGRWIGVWWTLGPYDLVVVSEAPDEETATRQLLAAGMQGNVRTMTMRAFSEEEMERIVQGLP